MSNPENADGTAVQADLENEPENVGEDALRNNRRIKLGQLTRRMNIIKELMKDDSNLNEIKENVLKYRELLEEFDIIQGEYQRVLKESERKTDQETWYAPKREVSQAFLNEVDQWLNAHEDEEISPSDSASKKAVDVGSKVSQTSSALRRAAAEKAALEVKLAALKEKHAIECEEEELVKKQEKLRKKKEILTLTSELDAANAKVAVLSDTRSQSPSDGMNEHLEETLKLQESKESIGKDPDELKLENVQASIQDVSVRPKAHALPPLPLSLHARKEQPHFLPTLRPPIWPDQSRQISSTQPTHTLPYPQPISHTQPTQTLPFPQAISSQTTYEPSRPRVSSRLMPPAPAAQRSHGPSQLYHPQPQSEPPHGPSADSGQSDIPLHDILQRQNDITASLIRQQDKSSLPRKEIKVFNNDPIEYRSFIRSFEHIIESRIEHPKDKLYYLEQYTSGQSKELVRTCLFLEPHRGFAKAKELLQEHFGNEYKISSAYINKALLWTPIKPEDSQTLNSYALYLRGCLNAMEEIAYMDELNLSSNLKLLISKLPYRLRERWRVEACNFQESTKQRATFKTLVEFIEKQVKILTDPVFGDIQNPPPSGQSSRPTHTKSVSKPKFTSAATVDVNLPSQKRQNTAPVTQAKPLCLFCSGEHILGTCSWFKRKRHTEKISFLKERGICFACLVSGHMSKDCAQRQSCAVCTKLHPTALHIGRVEQNKGTEEATKAPKSENIKPASLTACIGAGDEQCVMSIVPVQVKSNKGNKTIQTYAFLDPGSSATFCTDKLMHQLNLQGKKTNIQLHTLGQERTMSTDVITGLEVSGLHDNLFIALPEVYTQPKIPVTKKNIPNQRDLSKWPYLKDVKISTIDADIGMLIGTNAPKAIEPWQIINSQGEGPYAVRTLLGWVVNGPLREGTQSKIHPLRVNRISVHNLHEMLIAQYNTDFSERACEEIKEMSIEDKRFLKIADESAKIVDGHYSLKLPFRNDDSALPNNRCIAEQRLQSLKRKFIKNKEFKEEYVTFVTDMITKEYAEAVPKEQLARMDGQVWYLPHHGVYHPKKRKLRVVFDCGASFCGKALNAELLKGPDLTNSLIDVLNRFRQEPVGLMADITAMFHQVKVQDSDADFLRFLWWQGGDVSLPPVEHRMTVHLFGATSSPSCASYALRRTAKDNREHFSPEVVDTVLHNFYVDDLLKSVSTAEAAKQLITDITTLLHRGGFHLSKWATNSREVLASIPVEDRVKEIMDLNLDKDKLPTERALGLQWCIESDSFTFNVQPKQQPLTRRGILSMVCSIYDPLGFLTPFTLTAKLLLQQLCKVNIGWDEEVPRNIHDEWSKWSAGFPLISKFKVQRCFKMTGFGPVTHAQLHHFADASDQGFGTASYLRLVNGENNVHVALVMGKGRVAPLKRMTIPRMELAAAMLATKMDKLLKSSLQLRLDRSVFWTDSQSVIKYISNEHSRYKTFVANRVAAIRDASELSQWNYIDSKSNPADDVTRGQNAEKFLNNTRWLNGPEILWENEQKWAVNIKPISPLAPDDPEVKRTHIVSTTVCIKEDNATHRLITHFSDWTKLTVAVSWFLKLKETLQKLVQIRKQSKVTTRGMTNKPDHKLGGQRVNMEDLKAAELAIVRFVQSQFFSDEIKTLTTKTPKVKRESTLHRLDPTLKDGIMRVGGRLNKIAFGEERKFPAIIPKNSHLATLLLRHIHSATGHGGRGHMLSELRKKYWIVNANSAARKILSKCVVCKRYRARVGEQMMADLPQERLQPDLPPFTNTGVDYFGPFEVKRGRATVKRYGVLFTCMTSRAIHIEVASSLDTSSCINAVRRFICRRGQVKYIRSDNGTNFVGAKRELQKAFSAMDPDRIQNTLRNRGIEWTFNPPGASHHGGIWERLIRSVRQVLCSVLKQQTLDEEGLQTVLCEVEAILNSRPLTTVTNDSQDLLPLTPNDLLLLKARPVLPPGVFTKDDLYTKRRWKQVQYLANLFWRRWTLEYLPLLQERQKWNVKRRNFQCDDVVLVVDPTSPRGSWILGRIIEVYPDKRGLVRTAKIKTQTNIIERPITKLCLMLEGEEEML